MTPSARDDRGAGARASHKLSDHDVIQRVLGGDAASFEVLMRRHNQRVFRATRGIVRSDADAEDAAQDAWLAAFRALGRFDGRAAFSTWLTRIAIRRALSCARKRQRRAEQPEADSLAVSDERDGPEWQAHRSEMARVVEAALSGLRPRYRVVLLLRDLEHMSTAATAQALRISEDNVRVRLHRARAALSARILSDLERAEGETFPFDGNRCDRMVRRVLSTVRPAAQA